MNDMQEELKRMTDDVKRRSQEIDEEWARTRKLLQEESALRASGLPERFPLALPVKDRDGRTGVVVGYSAGKALVQQTGIPSTETPPPVALATEHIAPVHPRPSRYELLAAVEEALLRVARDRPVSGTVESQARAALALAQARALL